MGGDLNAAAAMNNAMLGTPAPEVNVPIETVPVNINKVPEDTDTRQSGMSTTGINASDMEDYLQSYYDQYHRRMWGDAQQNPVFHQQDDLLRGDQQRNFNNMTGQQTLRHSRLADALNNKYYRTARRIDDRTATHGGGTSGSEGDFGQLYQMPIITEEQRQAERLRQYEAQIRQREISRQQGRSDLELEQDRKQYEEYLRVTLGLNNEQIRQKMVVWDYAQNWYEERRRYVFDTFREVRNRISIPTEISNMLITYGENNPAFAMYFGVLAGLNAGASDPRQLMFAQRVAQVLHATRNATPEKRQEELEAVYATDAVGVTAAQWQAFMQALNLALTRGQ